ncbi:MAG: GNAT family N-acetyltransferase [Planctomycetota bacterium]
MGSGGAITIRRLTLDDVGAYTRLRAAMVEAEPFAFLGAPGDDDCADATIMRARLASPETEIVAAEADGALVGSAGVYRDQRVKTRHRATIWGVYVAPTVRARGVGRGLVSAAIEIARGWSGVELVQLSVSARHAGARRLYERLGFVAWGEEPDAIIVNGERASEVFMQRRL